MSTWLSKYTCPGWMFVPRKPRPFGNEYHSICCGVSGLMFGIELVEGKDRPKELPSPPKNEKTTHLLLNLCRSLYGTGKIVVVDSGFSVMKGLVALKKVGVYAHAVAKKRRFWPKCVPGDKIDSHMESKEVGEVDCLNRELDGERYKIFAMKEPDYTMKLMATYGGLTVPDDEKVTERYVDGQKKLSNTPRIFRTISNTGTWSMIIIISDTPHQPWRTLGLRKHGNSAFLRPSCHN